MKTLVFNIKGGVGKSFLSLNVILPLLAEGSDDIAVIETDDENQAWRSYEKSLILNKSKLYRAVELSTEKLIDKVFESENVLIDVGAGSYERFLQDYKNYLVMFDYIFIPTSQDSEETSMAIESKHVLADNGVSDDCIILVLNKYNIKKDISQYALSSHLQREFSKIKKIKEIHEDTMRLLKRAKVLLPEACSVFNAEQLLQEFKQAKEKDPSLLHRRALALESKKFKDEIIQEFGDLFNVGVKNG